METNTSEPPGSTEQQQQQQQPQEHEEQHDVCRMLSLVLSSLDDPDQRTCARYLARASRSARAVAIATLKQLPLSRYWRGRTAAQAILQQPVSSNSSSNSSSSSSGSKGTYEDSDTSSDVWVTTDGGSSVPDDSDGTSNVSEVSHSSSSDAPKDTGSSSSSSREYYPVSSAALKAAALPPVPWRLLADLADAGTLTSLDISAPQAGHLQPGCPTDATPAAAAAAPRRSAFLAGLCSLVVRGIDTELVDVERLICSCSGLTELELGISVPAYSMGGNLGPTAAVYAATSGCHPRWHLPHLRRLAMYGGPSWLVNGWLDRIGPAKLTAVKLEHQAATGVDLARLAACTQLQELVLRHVSKHHWGVRKGRALSRLLLQLTSLTRFEVLGARGVGLLDGQVPPGVWGLAQLRALDLNRSWQFLELPSGISSLRQLTFLGVTGSRLQELPHQLGAWLPQLQVREADDTALEAIPHGLSRLTRLHVNRCDVRNVSAGSRLVSLQALHISGSYLQPRYGALSNLSKLLCLRTLMITNYRGRATGVPGPLPCLRVLQLAASSNHVQVASQLVGSGQQLTRLELCGVGPDQVEVLGQLGVLPVLQEFALSRSHVTSLAPAGNWLQQQPQLTSLSVDCLETNVERCQLGPLPIGLQRLITTGLDVWQDASVRESLVQLSGLRVLNLYSNHIQAPQLPSWWLQWVLSLLHLEELRLSGVSAPYTWRAAVAKLPLLRDVHACTSPYMAELN